MGTWVAQGVMEAADVKPLELVIDVTTDLLSQSPALETARVLEEVLAIEKIKQALAERLGGRRHGSSSVERGADRARNAPDQLVLTRRASNQPQLRCKGFVNPFALSGWIHARWQLRSPPPWTAQTCIACSRPTGSNSRESG